MSCLACSTGLSCWSDHPALPYWSSCLVHPISLSRLVIIVVSKSGFFHAVMVKSRLYSPLRDKYGSSKVPPPDLGTQIRTSLRYLSLKHRCVWVDKTLGLRLRVLSTQTQLCFAERNLPICDPQPIIQIPAPYSCHWPRQIKTAHLLSFTQCWYTNLVYVN